MKICGVDPGVVTGVCVLECGVGGLGVGAAAGGEGGKVLWSMELGPARGFYEELETARAVVRIGEGFHVDAWALEDFVLRLPAKSTDRDGLSPVRILVLIMVELHRLGLLPTATLMPSSALAVLPSKRLRALGVWVKGEHARDALRHAILLSRKLNPS